MYPLDTLGVESRFYSFLLILFAFTLSIAGTAFFWGLFSFFINKLNRESKFFLIPLITASAFVLAEYTRAWGLGIIWLGSGSFLGPHWTLGNPAYLLSSLSWIVKSSSIWGIYGIDFLIIFLLSALILSIKKEGDRKKMLLGEILIAFAILFVINNIIISKQQSAPLTVSFIQTKNPTKINYSPEELLNNFGQENTMLKNAAEHSDIIVFPETANFSQTLSEFFNPTMVQKYFNNLSPRSILVVDSDRVVEPSGLKSKVIFIDSKNGIAGYYDKKLLTPGGEFLPYILKIPLSIFEYFQKNNSADTEFTSGSGINIIVYQSNSIKVLACSDIVSPSISGGGMFDLILDLGSLGMFKGDNRIANEIVAMARFRAAENGKYLILASNFGRSYVISPAGLIEKSTPETGYKILTVNVVSNKEQTWYNKLGDLPILLLSLAIFGLGLINLKDAKQN